MTRHAPTGACPESQASSLPDEDSPSSGIAAGFEVRVQAAPIQVFAAVSPIIVDLLKTPVPR
jgi:hypothetical protein